MNCVKNLRDPGIVDLGPIIGIPGELMALREAQAVAGDGDHLTVT
jgi:hypothetical protein